MIYAVGDSSINLGSLEDRNGPGWDQFEVNARRFQVKSTYQEELYTTPLDVTAIPQSVKDKADQIAREIEAAQYGTLDPDKIGEGDLEDDEEARFGAVKGTGAFRLLGGEVPQRLQVKPNSFLPTSPSYTAPVVGPSTSKRPNKESPRINTQVALSPASPVPKVINNNGHSEMRLYLFQSGRIGVTSRTSAGLYSGISLLVVLLIQ